MPTRNLHDRLLAARALVPQTITSSALTSQSVDLKGFDSNLFVIDLGSIPELGASPVGGAQIVVRVEESDDAATWAAAAVADVDGQTIDSSGDVTITNDESSPFAFSYIGANRYVRLTLTPTGLSTGGPVGVTVIKGHAHIEPVSNATIS